MKTHIVYFVDGRDGTSYNGNITICAKASKDEVIRSTFDHAHQQGFAGKPITITATGCAEPMLAQDIQPPEYASA